MASCFRVNPVDLSAGGTIFGDLIITGDLTVQGSSTVEVDSTVQGQLIIDTDNVEALLVRMDGDMGDVLIVDTVNDAVHLGADTTILTFGASTDVVLKRVGAGILALDDDTTEPFFQVVSGSDDTIGGMRWLINDRFQVGTFAASPRNVQITRGDVTVVEVTNAQVIVGNPGTPGVAIPLTFPYGDTPADIIILDTAALTADGQRDSHSILWTAKGFESATPHDVDWKMFVDAQEDDGTDSIFTIQTRIDAAAYADVLTLTDAQLDLNFLGGPTAAAISFSDPDTGIFATGLGVGITVNSNSLFFVSRSGVPVERVSLGSGTILTWNSGAAHTGGPQFGLARNAADALGAGVGDLELIASHFSVYDDRASASSYTRTSIRFARATLSALSGASVTTATSLIPDGAIVLGVTTIITTALGTSNGTTGYEVGDGSDTDRWGSITGTAINTFSDNADFTNSALEIFTGGPSEVTITALGGNFDGTGEIEITVHYIEVGARR